MNRIAYLNNAATTWPKPDSVYRFMDAYCRDGGLSPVTSRNGSQLDFADMTTDLRRKLTVLCGGDTDAPERLCFTYNATDALNIIIQGILSEGDHVVTTKLEHNSVVRPVNHMVRDHGVTATFVPFDEHGFVNPDDIAAAISDRTKLVIVNHGSNVLGTIQPVKEIGRICREKGVLFALDVAQTLGVIPVDMQSFNADVLAFTGHKFLMGYSGLGGLYVRKHVNIRQNKSGGTGVLSELPYHLDEYPYRLEFGTLNMVGVASLWKALEWREFERQKDDRFIDRGCKQLQVLADGLHAIPGVNTYCCQAMENHLPTTTITIDGYQSPQAGDILRSEFGVDTKAGLHCAPLVHEQIGTMKVRGGIRFSLGHYTTDDDIRMTIEAVAEMAAHPEKWAKTVAVDTISPANKTC